MDINRFSTSHLNQEDSEKVERAHRACRNAMMACPFNAEIAWAAYRVLQEIFKQYKPANTVGPTEFKII